MTIQFNRPVDVGGGTRRAGESEPVSAYLSAKRGTYYSAGKRLMDLVLLVLAFPIAVPLIGLCALLVSLDGAAPFYWQRRVGLNGTVFNMLKLRTMVVGADRVLESYLASNPEARREWDSKQKLCRDPRITRIGSILRKTSLDELPQLWNVFRGDMSLVGPRPMMPEQMALYPGLAYYSLRPGITGLWQVSERNESCFSDRATFDTEYYRTLSFGTDISILFRTIGVVMRGTGY